MPDVRQEYADSWPDSIDGSVAEDEWGWNPKYDLETMVDEMLREFPGLSLRLLLPSLGYSGRFGPREHRRS